MQSGIACPVELEPAVRSGRVEDDALRIDRRALRHAPGRRDRHPFLPTSERGALGKMDGDGLDMRAEAGLVGDLSFAAENIGRSPFADWFGEAPARRETKPVSRRYGDIAQVADPGREQIPGGPAIMDKNRAHAARLSLEIRAGMKSGP